MILIIATALSALYATLDPSSISQHFAFYELYPETEEGRESLKHAWSLLSGGCENCVSELKLPNLNPQPLISFINRIGPDTAPLLDENSLAVIERLSRHLGNRALQGFGIWDEKKLFEIPDEQIDLARGLLLADLGNSPEARRKIRSYEAHIDLMPLGLNPMPLRSRRSAPSTTTSSPNCAFDSLPALSMHEKSTFTLFFPLSSIAGAAFA
jgi:hypothetical protein